MANQFVEVEAPTPEEGLKIGAEILKVTPEEVGIEILEEGKKGWWGKDKPYKLKIYLKGKKEEKKELEDIKETKPEKKEEEIAVSEEIMGEYGIYYFTKEGLYITIPPPVPGKMAVNFVQILEEVTRYGFERVDLDALREAVEKAGSKILIAPPQPKKLVKKRLIKIVEPKESYIKFEFKEDGTYITPVTIKGKSLKFDNALQEIKTRGLKEVDMDALREAIEVTLQPTKIAPPQPPEVLKNGEVKIEISQDEMEGKITVIPPFGGEPIDKEEVKKELTKYGIVIPVDEEQLEELIEAGQKQEAVLTIWGKEPQPGDDAKLEFLFGREKEKTPVELEDGRVDYRDLGLIENVTKGQILVQKIPPTLGTPGYTITGKEIPPISGKDIPLPMGKGTEVSEDGMQLLASIDGCPVIEKEKVNVLPLYEVKGNVDFSIGNIDFVGNVIIRGSVTSGFTVKSGGNVEISGNVEDATVEAAGKVIIRGGVYGRGKASVSAGDEVSVRFVENAKVSSKGNIKIGEAAMHSTLLASKKIMVAGKKGLIVGGLTRAGEEVKCRTIGNQLATPTEVEVGVNPELREELKNLEKKIEIDQDNLIKTQNAIEGLKQLQKEMGDLPQAKKDLLLKLTRTQFQLMSQLKSAIERKTELESATKEVVAAKISASDRIYPGVRVAIKGAVLLVSEELKFVTLYERNDEIKTGTYR